MDSPSTAIDLYRQVRRILLLPGWMSTSYKASNALKDMGLEDPILDQSIQHEEEAHDQLSRQTLEESKHCE